jgi:predicted alpha/beta superfamily hydrolase
MLLILFIFNLLDIQVTAQHGMIDKTGPFVLGLTDTLYSAELRENRILNIYLPDGYSPDSAGKFQVIYLLDGSANEDFIHITGIVQFLNMIDTIPKAIVVGIANVDRRRDFTFPTSIEKDKKDFPTTGGSAKFIRFLEKDLQPYVRKKYSSNESRTIIGQSLGGLLATEILFRKPGLFKNYLIVSPSLWWDNESLLALAPQMPEKQVIPGTRVYISAGNEGKIMVGDAERLVEILKSSGQKKLSTTYMPLPGENHLTILHNSAYIGLETLFAK